MAKSTKRASKKKADPFAEFEDWLVGGPAGVWPFAAENNRLLTHVQEKIVADNAALLLNRTAWKEKADRFEVAISTIEGDERQKEKRAEYEIHFDRHQFFDEDKDFSAYKFPCSLSFVGVNFGKGVVDFTKADFGEGGVDFTKAEFGEGNVYFTKADFGEGNVMFFNVIFGGAEISFFEAEFGDGDVYFSGAEFGKGEIHFGGANFGVGNVAFHSVKFGSRYVDFSDAKFGEGKFSFQNASFRKGDVYFIDMNMQSAIFEASDMVVEGSFLFNSTVVKSASFQRLKVEGTASFSESEFAEVPDFRDAQFGRSPEVARMIVPPPSMKTKKRWWHFSRVEHKEDVAKYRKLKAMALAANDHEKDGEFFAYEMMAKRGHETESKPELFFNSIYWGLSDFGQSFVKPVMWWMGSFYWFAFSYLLIMNNGITNASLGERVEAIWFAFRHSFQNSVPIVGGFFRFTFRPDNSPDRYQDVYKILAEKNPNIELLNDLTVVQYAFGAVLLFFFGLALRNKFRLK